MSNPTGDALAAVDQQPMEFFVWIFNRRGRHSAALWAHDNRASALHKAASPGDPGCVVQCHPLAGDQRFMSFDELKLLYPEPASPHVS